MAYNGNWINQLVVTSPAGTESKSLGDDSIREIKRALQNSFPDTEDGDFYSGKLSDLTRAVANIIPRGVVAAYALNFDGANAAGPPGWTIADGRNYRTGAVNPTPNLVGRFIFGAKPPDTPPEFWPQPPKYVGGDTELNVRIGGTGAYKTYSTAGTTLTAAQSGVPAHVHDVVLQQDGGGGRYDGGGSGAGHLITTLTTVNNVPRNAQEPHTHTFQIKADYNNITLANMPPYYTLVWIVKD
jgi:hypothetical protein